MTVAKDVGIRQWLHGLCADFAEEVLITWQRLRYEALEEHRKDAATDRMLSAFGVAVTPVEWEDALTGLVCLDYQEGVVVRRARSRQEALPAPWVLVRLYALLAYRPWEFAAGFVSGTQQTYLVSYIIRIACMGSERKWAEEKYGEYTEIIGTC